jgi:hypothetical protein
MAAGRRGQRRGQRRVLFAGDGKKDLPDFEVRYNDDFTYTRLTWTDYPYEIIMTALMKDKNKEKTLIEKIVHDCGGVRRVARKIWDDEDSLISLQVHGIPINTIQDIEAILTSSKLRVEFHLVELNDWKDDFMSAKVVTALTYQGTGWRDEIVYYRILSLGDPDNSAARFELWPKTRMTPYGRVSKDLSHIRDKYMAQYFVDRVNAAVRHYMLRYRLSLIKFRIAARTQRGLGR